MSRDELLMTESAMEACRETLDMTRLSIKEKETELLQALDQLLLVTHNKQNTHKDTSQFITLHPLPTCFLI